MSTPQDPDDILAAEFALGLLEGEDLAQARARAEADAGFAQRVVAWQARLAPMADLDPVPPPASVKRALLAELFPSATVPVPFWQRLGLWQALTGAAVAGMILLALFLPPVTQQPAGPLYTAEIVSAEGDFRVVAVVDKSANEVLLTRTAGAAPAGRILQVWAHGPGEPAQSVGLWPEGESLRLPLPAEIAAVQGTLTLGVSEEPPGGSPTGLPSGRVFGTVDIPNVGAAL